MRSLPAVLLLLAVVSVIVLDRAIREPAALDDVENLELRLPLLAALSEAALIHFAPNPLHPG